MDNIRHLPTTDSIQLEASEWIMRLQNENAGAEDWRQFELWKAANPRHEQAYQELAATWNDLRSAGRIARAVSFGQAINASGLSGAAPASSGRGSLRHAGFAAAAVLTAFALGIAWWVAQWGPQTIFQTAIGEHASIELPDGSKLELNSNSLARVAYSERARTIYLNRGEAFFKVAHQAERPFWVVAGSSWIRAVGTAFNVDLRASGVRVTVSEGVVKVAAGRAGNEPPSDALLTQAVVSVLTAGQQAEVKSDGAQIQPVSRLEQNRLNAWRKGTLYFDDQSLASVVEEANRYTASRIYIENPALARRLVGGTFEASPGGVEALLTMLQEGLGLRVRREDGKIFVDAAK